MKLARVALFALLSTFFAPRAHAQQALASPEAPAAAQPLQAPPEAVPPSPLAPLEAQTVPSAPAQLLLSQSLVRRAERLGGDLAGLERRSRGRLASGIIQIGLGTGLATLGAVMANEFGRSLLILVGAGAVAHGTFTLTLPEDAAALSRAYEALPVFTPAQLKERVRFGEQALGRIARGARRARIAEGTVTMAVAAAYIPLLWWLERRADSSYRFGDSAFDYVGLALSGINFASGLVTALVSSDAERRLHDYEALRASLASEQASHARALSLQIGMLRGGARVSGQLRF